VMAQVGLSVAPSMVQVHGFAMKLYCRVAYYVKNCLELM